MKEVGNVSKNQVKNIQQNCSFARLHKIVRMNIYNSVHAWSLNHTRVYNFGPDTNITIINQITSSRFL